MKKPSLYLGGPIGGLKAKHATGWRKDVRHILSPHYKILDPLDFGPIQPGEKDQAATVKQDIHLVAQADIMLAWMWQISPGTCMEMVYAKMARTKVVLAAPAAVQKRFWIPQHADHVFDTLPEAVDFILHMTNRFSSCTRVEAASNGRTLKKVVYS